MPYKVGNTPGGPICYPYEEENMCSLKPLAIINVEPIGRRRNSSSKYFYKFAKAAFLSTMMAQVTMIQNLHELISFPSNKLIVGL